MAYETPGYNYASQTNALAQNKGLSDVANNYGRFLSQERFRRQGEDAGNQFRRNMPKVGGSYNRRGIYNSGLRREGQRRYAGDYQRDVNRMGYDQAAEAQQFDMVQTQSDAAYQQALNDLYNQYQYSRAAGYDPFAAVRSM
jgi:hypothetical protein